MEMKLWKTKSEGQKASDRANQRHDFESQIKAFKEHEAVIDAALKNKETEIAEANQAKLTEVEALLTEAKDKIAGILIKVIKAKHKVEFALLQTY